MSNNKFWLTTLGGLFAGLIGVLYLPVGLKSLEPVTLSCSIALLWVSLLLILESIGERIHQDVVNKLYEDDEEEEPEEK